MVVGASTGLFGAVWAQDAVRRALGIMGADVLDGELPVGMAATAFDDDGGLLDADLRGRLGELVHVLAARSGNEEAQAA
jgi:chromate reductase